MKAVLSILEQLFCFMRMLTNYKNLQLLSIDVVIGACMMAFATSLVLEVSIPWSVYFCLGGAVWLVYTIDHLLDAREIQQKVVSERHSFHLQYFNTLIKVWLVVLALVLTVTLTWLPIVTIKFGLIAAALVVMHLVLVKMLGTKLSILVQKEFGVAIAYVVGVTIGPLSLSEQVPRAFYFYAVQVFLLAFINLLEFSYFDKRVDQLQGQVSLSVILGRNKLQILIIALLVICFSLSLYSIMLFGLNSLDLVLFSAWAVLMLIMLTPKTFIRNDYYRVFGDMVFLFPIVLL